MSERISDEEPRHIRAYHEDFGPVVWWTRPVAEPPWVGSPLYDDWPGYHQWWTPLPPLPRKLLPKWDPRATAAQAGEARQGQDRNGLDPKDDHAVVVDDAPSLLSRLSAAEAARDDAIKERDQLRIELRKSAMDYLGLECGAELENDKLRAERDAACARAERVEKALEATTYLASLYRACWLRKPVRDLAEAEAWVASTTAALASPAP